MKKIICIIFLLCFLSSFISTTKTNTINVNSSLQIVDVTKITASSYTINRGSLVSGALTNINQDDASNMSFIETKEIFAGTEIAAPTSTEDDASEWAVFGGFSSVSAVLTSPYVGTYCIEAVTSSGDAYLTWDNGTSNDMNFDLTGIILFNVSLRTNVPAGRLSLYQIRFYSTSSNYGYVDFYNLSITATWAVVTACSSDITFVGDFDLTSTIDYITFIFDPWTISGRKVWVDGGGFYGTRVGETTRELSVDFTFPAAGEYDNAVLNISVQRQRHTDYDDDFWTEDATNWGNTGGVTISDDASAAIHGTNAIKFIYDDAANTTIFFDNGTTKNMQADFSDYNAFYIARWANISDFSGGYGRAYTNTSSYYQIQFEENFTNGYTASSASFIPLGFFSSVGSPTWSNISWIEVAFNTTHSGGPAEIYFDHMYIGTSAGGVFNPTCCDEVFQFGHAHEYLNTTLDLHERAIIENELIVSFTDTLASPDLFNTTYWINYLFMIVWNDQDQWGGNPDEESTTEPGSINPDLLEDFSASGLMILGIAIFSIFFLAFAFKITAITIPTSSVFSSLMNRFKQMIQWIIDLFVRIISYPFSLISLKKHRTRRRKKHDIKVRFNRYRKNKVNRWFKIARKRWKFR